MSGDGIERGCGEENAHPLLGDMLWHPCQLSGTLIRLNRLLRLSPNLCLGLDADVSKRFESQQC